MGLAGHSIYQFHDSQNMSFMRIIIAILFVSLLEALAIFSFATVYDIYMSSNVSNFLPFWLVIITLIACIGFVFWVLIFKNIDFCLKFILFVLPMSALPFIVLGYPLERLNQEFVCRSSVVFMVFILLFRWLNHLAMDDGLKSLNFPLLGNATLLLLIYIVNTIFVVEKHYLGGAIEALIVQISCILFFIFLTNYIRSENVLDDLFKILLISCFIQSIFSIPCFFYYLVIKGFLRLRVEGLLRDFELFAEYLVLHIPIVLYLIRNTAKNSYFNKFCYICVPVIFFALFITNTRGALISLLIGMAYYFFMMNRGGMPLERIIKTLFFIILAGVPVLWILYNTIPQATFIIERLMSTDLTSLDTRQYVWMRFFKYFLCKPVWGYGIVYDLRSYLFWPHSTYFAYLLMAGIAGLGAYLLFVFRIALIGLKNIALTKSSAKAYEMSVVLNTLLIIFLVDSIKVEHLRYPNYQLFIWTIFAFIVAWRRIHGMNNACAWRKY